MFKKVIKRGEKVITPQIILYDEFMSVVMPDCPPYDAYYYGLS